MTTSSSVFREPCAPHVLAMMLALGRQLLPSYQDQLTDHRWEYLKRRYDSRLLTGQFLIDEMKRTVPIWKRPVA